MLPSASLLSDPCQLVTRCTRCAGGRLGMLDLTVPSKREKYSKYEYLVMEFFRDTYIYFKGLVSTYQLHRSVDQRD